MWPLIYFWCLSVTLCGGLRNRACIVGLREEASCGVCEIIIEKRRCLLRPASVAERSLLAVERDRVLTVGEFFKSSKKFNLAKLLEYSSNGENKDHRIENISWVQGTWTQAELLELPSNWVNNDYRKIFHEFGVHRRIFHPTKLLELLRNSRNKDYRGIFDEFGVV